MKIIKCSNCGAFYPQKLKVCPQCNEKNDKSKPKAIDIAIKTVSCILAFVIIIIMIKLNQQNHNENNIILASSDTAKTSDVASSVTEKKRANNKIYNIGETANISSIFGNYKLKITRVKESKRYNEFHTDQPQRIIIIEYAYENVDCDEDITISYVYFRVYDSEGNLCDDYPSIDVKYPNTISAGGKKDASFAIGLNNNTNKLKLQFYNIDYSNFGRKAECTFNLEW